MDIVAFCQPPIKPEKTKKFLLQKLWRSYKVNSGYQIVKLPAFNQVEKQKFSRWETEN